MGKGNILVTGAAGFIGFHVVKHLCESGFSVTGLDNLNDYYNPVLKKDRLKELGVEGDSTVTHSSRLNFTFHYENLENHEKIMDLFHHGKFDYIVHLAAQAGVRYSLENPQVYINSNITGFLNILEACRKYPVKHLIFASSSSVYGLNKEYPFSENHTTDHPISIYAATKKANEMMAHTYAHLFKIPVSGLRFFTVYGPWGRPDMAPIIFASRILNNTPIDVFNNGEMYRDFTFVSDVAHSILLLLSHAPVGLTSEINQPTSTSSAPFKLYNIGNNNPIKLGDFISALEIALDRMAVINNKPIQPGDVVKTYADSSSLYSTIGFKPQTILQNGVNEFATWYKSYHGKI